MRKSIIAQNKHMPKEYCWTGFCGKSQCARDVASKKYAFVTLLFPNPSNKAESPYMAGNIATALALRRQDTRAELVCMVTPDVDPETIKALEIVYDRVVIVEYIRPHESVINTFRESYLNMFTKLHIFNLPYKKVCLVDSDIIPLRNYDALFDLNTPAGILEPPRGSDGADYGFSHRCIPKCGHGQKIPHQYTDLWLPDAGDMNAGLWVITPDAREFKDILREISRPASEWIYKGSKYGGYYDSETNEVNYYYTWPEQQYLTSRYSGKWYSIGYEFASWCVRPAEMNGVHYVPFRKMPWSDTFAKSKRREHDFAHVECLQLFFIVMYEGLVKYPQLLKNARFRKYARNVIDSLESFSKTRVTDGAVKFKSEKKW